MSDNYMRTSMVPDTAPQLPTPYIGHSCILAVRSTGYARARPSEIRGQSLLIAVCASETLAADLEDFFISSSICPSCGVKTELALGYNPVVGVDSLTSRAALRTLTLPDRSLAAPFPVSEPSVSGTIP